MKPEIRVLGFDDGPFVFGDATTDVVGVLMRGGAYIEGILTTKVEVDGTDATEKILDLLSKSRYVDSAQILMFDGASMGGFNVLNLERIHEIARLPVVSVSRDAPDFAGIEAALRKHFPDADTRLAILKRNAPTRYDAPAGALHVRAIGISPDEVRDLLRITTVRGNLPEPVRMAHLIASAIGRGESYGRA